MASSARRTWRPLDRLRAWAHLRGLRFMQPTLANQKLWARQLGGFELSEVDSPWRVLRERHLPLFERHASAAHRRGLRLLGLDAPVAPTLSELEDRTGWALVPCSGEVPSREFFELLARRAFPVAPGLRPLRAVFCGYEPDFWHEAVGHLTCLTDPEVSRFYQWSGRRVTELHASGDGATAERLARILWVALEYGFVREGGEPRTFGAAITGSFMGLQRLARGHLAFAPFKGEAVLESRIFEEGYPAPRDWKGRIVLFESASVEAMRAAVEEWLEDRSPPGR